MSRPKLLCQAQSSLSCPMPRPTSVRAISHQFPVACVREAAVQLPTSLSPPKGDFQTLQHRHPTPPFSVTTAPPSDHLSSPVRTQLLLVNSYVRDFWVADMEDLTEDDLAFERTVELSSGVLLDFLGSWVTAVDDEHREGTTVDLFFFFSFPSSYLPVQAQQNVFFVLLKW
ncbi:hypothetical protein U1Q18_002969 [Sarracenia purpurea var. burkii]